MSTGLLPDHIGPLVDRLRSGAHQPVALPDVAALTEILMRSLESYFKSIDLTLYQECQSLADYINDARKEIVSLSPDHSDEAGIPRAGLELDAIVQATESATNTIMESAESIMSADFEDPEAYQETVNDAVMKIFEACSFQDITGQRISKVVNTLSHVEERVDSLINILGIMDLEGKKAQSEDTQDDINEEDLLNGPALDGEGIQQSAVDDLMNDSAPAEPEASADAEPEPEPEPEMAAESEPEPEPEPEPAAEAIPEEVDQNDIDSLFDEAPAAPAEASPEEEKLDLIAEAKKKKAEAQAKAKARVKPRKPVAYEENASAALKPKDDDKTSQEDIDALFG